jgi:FMN hydrolase / 5-amino-6-(5-phospho-D-ribitylamino)uracil phosphatase
MPRIAVVTFDLDNTLWDVDAVIRNAERVTRQWFDTHVPELNATLAPADFLAIRQRMVVERPELAHDLSRIRRAVFEQAIRNVGRGADESRQLAAEAFQLFLAERHKVSFFEDALDVLERLARRHQLGALTNGNADIARLGLDRFFRFAFSAADVGAAKPAPQMFRAALAHADVGENRMIHVGDNPVDDIQGAADLGIPTIWVNLEGRNTESPPATRIVHRLKDIPNAIDEIEIAN